MAIDIEQPWRLEIRAEVMEFVLSACEMTGQTPRQFIESMIEQQYRQATGKKKVPHATHQATPRPRPNVPRRRPKTIPADQFRLPMGPGFLADDQAEDERPGNREHQTSTQDMRA